MSKPSQDPSDEPPTTTTASLLDTVACPACDLEAMASEQAIAELLMLLDRPDNRQLYTASDGLCVRHFYRLAPLADAETLTFLAADLEARLTGLWRETVDYFDKADWNSRHKPKGAEQTAWLRAIERFVGPDPRPVGAPQPRGTGQDERGG